MQAACPGCARAGAETRCAFCGVARVAGGYRVERILGQGASGRVSAATAPRLSGSRTFGAPLVGTFGYMPTEQLGGTVDATSDLYALGATLLHAATGKPPSDLLAGDFSLRVPGDIPLRDLISRLV